MFLQLSYLNTRRSIGKKYPSLLGKNFARQHCLGGGKARSKIRKQHRKSVSIYYVVIKFVHPPEEANTIIFLVEIFTRLASTFQENSVSRPIAIHLE